MEPKELQYQVDKSMYSDGEYVLWIHFDGNLSSRRVVNTWDHPPTQDEVIDAVSLGLRFIDCYLKSFTNPKLPNVVKWE